MLSAGAVGGTLRRRGVYRPGTGRKKYECFVPCSKKVGRCSRSVLRALRPSANAQNVTDQWLFHNDYANAIPGGKALIPITSASKTVNGTTFNVGAGGAFDWQTSVIGGQSVPVLHFTQNAFLVVPHGMSANGGGSYVNQYTILMDVMFPANFATTGSGYVALLNTTAANGNDADWYINPSGGMGISGDYSDISNPLLFTGGVWHRIALVLDDTQPTGGANTVYRSFIDGQLQNVVQSPGFSVDGRYSIYTKDDPQTPWFTMFGEGSDTTGAYEALNGWIHAMQVRDYAMSDAEIAALGGPTPGPIPIPTAAPPTGTVTGNIALEGISDLSAISPAAPLGTFHISFRIPGTDTEQAGYDVSLNAAGSVFGTYSISSVPPGTYDVAIQGAKNLRVVNAVVTVSAGGGFVPDTLLPAGDANGDNRVNVLDFGILVNAYGSGAAVSGSDYDAAADFNFDGAVDVLDFGLLVNEYGNSGPEQ